METKTNIWTKLLFIVAWIILLSGVFFGIIVPYFIPELIDLYLSEFNSNLVFDDITNGSKTMILFLFGVLGSIMIGWGTLLVFMTRRLFIKDEPWIWKAITTSAIIWFVFDSTVSLVLGTILNVFFNTDFLLLVMFPILGYYYSNWKTARNTKSISL